MKKILIITSLLLALTAAASPISSSQARQIASDFVGQRRSGVTVESTPVNLKSNMMANAQQSSFYIFNTTGKKGYVIVSGDDRTMPILGYVDNGNFDPNNIPPNMKEMLEHYAQEISMLDQLGITRENLTAPRPTHNSISPMI
ncbi:MAG: Spi family protease inhibitor, partial [Muribaculaceae bacterium]|nr:Spi family protease inhibitor [Muribaculaceae bacterium]